MSIRTFDDMTVDHVEFFVEDISTQLDWLVGGLGLAVHAKGVREPGAGSVGLGGGRIHLVLTQPLAGGHPAGGYVERHGDGVADIALGVADATAAFEEAARRGARPVASPAERDGVVTATIGGFGDVTHTFVQRREGVDERTLPGLTPAAPAVPATATGLDSVDHFAVCVEAGRLDETVEFYRRVLDFDLTFTERIVVGDQAIVTKAVQSGSRAVTLTLIEPDPAQQPGQIDAFLKNHDGAGVQHIAFTTGDIVGTVGSIAARGVEFLTTPGTYYTLLRERVRVERHPIDELRRLGVLVDEDHDGMLFQIFARSVHPRDTLFIEVIERLGAQTFGGGNIKALYEAVRLQQTGPDTGEENGRVVPLPGGDAVRPLARVA